MYPRGFRKFEVPQGNIYRGTIQHTTLLYSYYTLELLGSF